MFRAVVGTFAAALSGNDQKVAGYARDALAGRAALVEADHGGC